MGALAFALALASALNCFGERRGIARDSLASQLEATDPQEDLPDLDALLALRAPPAGGAPADLALLKPRDALGAVRLAAARGARELEGDPNGDVELLAQRCLFADARRDTARVIDDCGRFLDAAPGDPRAVPAVQILRRTGSETRRGVARVEESGARWLDRCGAARGPCFDLAAVITGDLLRAAERAAAKAGSKDTLKQAAQRAGRVLEVEADGPYQGDEVISFAGSALGAPLRAMPPYTRRFPLPTLDGNLAPATDGEAGLYVLRFVASAKGKGVIIAQSLHAMRVTIDGVTVIERRRDRGEPFTSRTGVELFPGDHVVEVLVFSAGRGDATTLAFVDEAGRAMARFKPLALRGADDARAGGAPNHGSGCRVRTLTGAVEALPLPTTEDGVDLAALDRALWRHALARAPRLALVPDDERAAAAALLRTWGWTPAALVAAATTAANDDELPRRHAWSFAAPLWSAVVAAWPDHVAARWALAAALRAEEPDRALDAVRALAKEAPASALVQRGLLDQALDNGLLDEGLAAARALLALERTPENLDAAARAFHAVGDARGAAALELEREQLIASPTEEGPARRALARGDTATALALFKRAAEAEPNSPARVDEIDALAAVDPARALELARRVAATQPDHERLQLRALALVWRVEGADAARKQARALALRMPNNAALMKVSEALDLPRPWQARLTRADEAIAARRARANDPFPGHGGFALIDDLDRVMALDGSSHSVRHLVVELRSKELIDRFGEMNVSDTRVLRLRVIKPDGRSLEPDQHAGVDDASLPALAPGDIVELLTADTAGRAPNPLGSYETRMLDLLSLPALERGYTFDAPKVLIDERRVTPVAQNGAPAPEVSEYQDSDGLARVRWRFALKDVEPARNEPNEPSRDETAQTVGFQWGLDARFFARVRGRALHIAATPGAWLTSSATTIAGTGTDEEKLRRLFTFVVRRIEPGDADDAAEVLATGQGERTPLFLALARAAGLDAEPVALHAVTQPPLGTVDGDAFALIAVRTHLAARDSYAIVDRREVLDALPAFTKGATVLDLSFRALAREEANTSELPDDVVDGSGVKVQIDLARQQKELKGVVVVTLPAALSDGMRRDLKKAQQEQIRAYVEQALQSSFPGMIASDVRVPNLDAHGTPLRIGAHVSLALTSLPDGTVRFERLFSSGAASAFAIGAPLGGLLRVAERKRPVLLFAEREELSLTIDVGAGSAVLEAPESGTADAGPIHLEQTSEVTLGKLVWHRTLWRENARVPLAEWPALRASLTALAARADARAAFVIGGP